MATIHSKGITQELARLVIDGHTHKQIARLTLGGVDYLNVGGAYGAPRLVIGVMKNIHTRREMEQRYHALAAGQTMWAGSADGAYWVRDSVCGFS